MLPPSFTKPKSFRKLRPVLILSQRYGENRKVVYQIVISNERWQYYCSNVELPACRIKCTKHLLLTRIWLGRVTYGIKFDPTCQENKVMKKKQSDYNCGFERVYPEQHTQVIAFYNQFRQFMFVTVYWLAESSSFWLKIFRTLTIVLNSFRSWGH